MMNSKLKEIAIKYSKGQLVVFLEGGYDLGIMGSASQNLLEELSGAEVTSFESYPELKLLVLMTLILKVTSVQNILRNLSTH